MFLRKAPKSHLIVCLGLGATTAQHSILLFRDIIVIPRTFNLNLICCADMCFDFVQGLGVKKKTKSKSIYTMCIILLLQSLCKLSYCFGCRLFAFNIRIYQNFKRVRFPLYLYIRMKPQRLV